MFAIVKHEHGELKINPNCYIRIIYDYIREQLNIPPDQEFDLYSADGSPCFIYKHRPDTDGLTILKPRQTYTLEVFRVVKDEDGEAPAASEDEVAEGELATIPSTTYSVQDDHQDAITVNE